MRTVPNLADWGKTILLYNLRVNPKTHTRLIDMKDLENYSLMLYARLSGGLGIKKYTLAQAAETRSRAGGAY